MMQQSSTELELGKCGEYFAIFSLMKQGFVAYLSDQGLPYDVVVDVNGQLFRGQVKSTLCLRDYGKSKQVYRFGTRSAKKSIRKTSIRSCDFYAFVAVNDQKIAFLSSKEIESSLHKGYAKQTIEFRSESVNYKPKTYSTGKVISYHAALVMENFSSFQRVVNHE